MKGLGLAFLGVVFSGVILWLGTSFVPADTIAYWRFEDAKVGQDSIDKAVDSSANQFDLTQSSEVNRPNGSSEVPVKAIPNPDKAQRTEKTTTKPSSANTRSAEFVPGQALHKGDFLTAGKQAKLDFDEGKAFTIEGWIFPQSYAEDSSCTRYVVFKRDRTYAGYGVALGSDGLLEFRVAADKEDQAASRSPDPVPLKTWTHFAAVRETDGTVRLYLNGKLVRTGASQLAKSLKNEGEFIVGDHGLVASPKFVFDGRIDEIRVSDVALKPEQFLNAEKQTAK